MILDLTQGSEEWKQVRRKWVTASDVPCILKVKGAFKSRARVMEEKLSGEKPLTPYEVNLFARGHEVEAELRKYAEELLKMPLPPVVVLDEEKGILASIDCYNAEKGVIVETKNSTSRKKLELAENYEVWEPYRVQILAQMLVTGVKQAWLCMRDDTTGAIHSVPVEEDTKTTEKIISESKKFLDELNAYANVEL